VDPPSVHLSAAFVYGAPQAAYLNLIALKPVLSLPRTGYFSSVDFSLVQGVLPLLLVALRLPRHWRLLKHLPFREARALLVDLQSASLIFEAFPFLVEEQLKIFILLGASQSLLLRGRGALVRFPDRKCGHRTLAPRPYTTTFYHWKPTQCAGNHCPLPHRSPRRSFEITTYRPFSTRADSIDVIEYPSPAGLIS